MYCQLSVKTGSQTYVDSSWQEGGHELGSVCPLSGPKEAHVISSQIPLVGTQSHGHSLSARKSGKCSFSIFYCECREQIFGGYLEVCFINISFIKSLFYVNVWLHSEDKNFFVQITVRHSMCYNIEILRTDTIRLPNCSFSEPVFKLLIITNLNPWLKVLTQESVQHPEQGYHHLI